MNLKPLISATSLQILLIALLLILGPSAVQAQVESKAAAIESAMEKNGPGGKVIGVKEKSSDGSDWFEVKILTNGKVRIYKIDKS